MAGLGSTHFRAPAQVRFRFRARLGAKLATCLAEQRKNRQKATATATTTTTTTITTAPLAVIVCYVSSHLIARQALAYVDLVVDFYTKLSYLSYNYETTWRMSNASCVSVSVSDSVTDSAILKFSHMNRSDRSDFLGHIIWPTLTPMRYVLGHRRVRLGFMALRIRRGGNSTPPADIASI